MSASFEEKSSRSHSASPETSGAAESETDNVRPADELSHWTERITARADCASCGAVRRGNYCEHCGQRHLQKRLTLRPLIGELVSRLTDFERGLFYTFLSLIRDPGKVAKDYVGGNQKKYVNPLTVFFIGTAVQLIAYWVSGDILKQQMEAAFQAQGVTFATPDEYSDLEKQLGQSLGEATVDTYLSAIQQAYTYSALFCYVFPFAALLCILHRALDDTFFMGETLVFALFVYGLVLVVTGLLTPFTLRLHMNFHSVMGPLVYLLIPQMAHGSFFARTWSSRLMTAIASILSILPLVLSIGLIFLVTFGFKIAFVDS